RSLVAPPLTSVFHSFRRLRSRFQLRKTWDTRCTGFAALGGVTGWSSRLKRDAAPRQSSAARSAASFITLPPSANTSLASATIVSPAALAWLRRGGRTLRGRGVAAAPSSRRFIAGGGAPPIGASFPATT